MPDWQIVEEAYNSLVKVRAAFDDALALVIDGRNAGALPVIELLASEVEHLTRALLAAFGAGPTPTADLVTIRPI